LSPLKQSLLPIPDHRRAQGKLYDLPHRLLFSILAVMSGATSYRRIHPFIRTHQARLNEAFGCRWRRTPAYRSIRYALHGLEVQAIAPQFRAHALPLAETVRSHWGIENRLDYALDTALGEDVSRIGKNPGVFAHLRHFALNLHSPIFSQTNPNIKTFRDPREILQSNR
jgi:hypothetical protein